MMYQLAYGGKIVDALYYVGDHIYRRRYDDPLDLAGNLVAQTKTKFRQEVGEFFTPLTDKSGILYQLYGPDYYWQSHDNLKQYPAHKWRDFVFVEMPKEDVLNLYEKQGFQRPDF